MIKPLSILLMFATASISRAEVYKCIEDGRTIFSDSPCGDSAVVVDVSISKQKTGAQFSNQAMDELGSQLGKERRTAELAREITRAEQNINDILDNYNLEKARLERELAEHRQKKYYNNWKSHRYLRDEYYETQQDLRNQLRAARREYKAEREKAYNKLASLRREQNQLQ